MLVLDEGCVVCRRLYGISVEDIRGGYTWRIYGRVQMEQAVERRSSAGPAVRATRDYLMADTAADLMDDTAADLMADLMADTAADTAAGLMAWCCVVRDGDCAKRWRLWCSGRELDVLYGEFFGV